MATSSSLLDDTIKNFLSKIPFGNYLDIGIGEGKFGKMIREMYPKARIVGIEPDVRFITNKAYNEVSNINVLQLMDRETDFTTDICIMGDVIEHLKKSEALDFLDFILYRCRYLIVKFPFCYIQYGNKLDRHNSIWFFEDFDNLHLEIVQKENDKGMCLVIIKGLLQTVDEMYKGKRKEILNEQSI